MLALRATEGRGCGHCEVGVPVEEVRSQAGRIRLCLECVLKWFPGKSVSWWESRHTSFLDHVDIALQLSEWKERLRAAARR